MSALCRRRITTIGVALVLAVAAADVLASDTAATLRARGLELGYNLDHLEEAIAANPADPAAYRLAAAITWIHLLFQQGAITSTTTWGRRAQTFRAPRRTVSSRPPFTISFVTRSR
jgi:hypothetical protein